MKTYARTRLTITVAIFAYVVIALQPWKPNGVELFPFFNWSLFSNSPANRVDVLVLVHEVDGETFNPAIPFHDLSDRFSGAGESIDFVKVGRDLANALYRQDDTDTKRLRSVLESRFMKEASQVRYELARAHYSPLERYKYGKFIAIDPIQKFVKGGSKLD